MKKKYKQTCNFEIDGLYSFFIRRAENGWLYPGEIHDFWEMMYCIKGCAIVCAGEELFELSCGQVIFFKPMQFHSFRVEESNSEFFITSFDLNKVFCESLPDKVFKSNFDSTKIMNDIISYLTYVASISNMEKCNQEICLALEKLPYSMNVAINLIENFIAFLLNGSDSTLQIVKTNDAKIYSSALAMIDDNIGQKITVKELAKACNVGQTYLKALFKKYNGLGIHEYILKIKITLAKQMLAEGKTVNEIYEELGFTSQSYMSTFFKRETGMSPTKYKNNFNQGEDSV